MTGPDGDLPVFARSAVKPLQALGSVRAGVLERFGLDRRHLALACASHGGSPDHVGGRRRGARGVRAGRGRARLRARAAARPARGRGRAAVADPPQLLGQARVRARPLPGRGLAARRLLPRRARAPGRDARLRRRGVRRRGAERGGDRRLRDAHVRRAARRARPRVRRRSPAAASGRPATAAPRRCAPIPSSSRSTGAIDTELMRAEPGLVAKIGAEGVLAVGLADGRGLALKVRDGALRAVPPAGVALVRAELGLAARGPRGARRRADRELPRRPRRRAARRLTAAPGCRRSGPINALVCSKPTSSASAWPASAWAPSRRSCSRSSGSLYYLTTWDQPNRPLMSALAGGFARARAAARACCPSPARRRAARATSSSSRGASPRRAGSRSSTTSTAAAGARSPSASSWRSRSPRCCTRCAARSAVAALVIGALPHRRPSRTRTRRPTSCSSTALAAAARR